MANKLVIALTSVRHNNISYQVGAQFVVSENIANLMVRLGAVRIVSDSSANIQNGTTQGGADTTAPSVGLNGKSAYELAVEAGFKGTLVEWLASLKGDKGDKGDSGAPAQGNGIREADLMPQQNSLSWDGRLSAGTAISADRVSDFVDVEANTEYTLITAVKGAPWCAIVFYNANKQMIGSRVALPQLQNEGMLADGKVVSKITLTSFADSAFARVTYRTYGNGSMWFGKTAEMPADWKLKLHQIKMDNNAIRPNGFRLVGHRGAELSTPENTAASYIRARELGFLMAECDIRKTKDGVFVLLHDSTIYRTARLHNASGVMVTTNLRTAADSAELYDRFGNRHTTFKSIVDTPVEQLTFEELDRFDYSISYEFSKTGGVHPIMKLTEFAALMKKLGMHPYIELRDHSEEDVQEIANIIIGHNLDKETTFVAFSGRMLTYAHKYCPNARKGYITDVPLTDQTKIASHKEEFGDKACMNLNIIHVTEENIAEAKRVGLDIEVWNLTQTEQLKQVHPYVRGVSVSDSISNSHLLHGDI